MTRTTLLNYGIVMAHHLGVPAGRLARWHQGKGGRGSKAPGSGE